MSIFDKLFGWKSHRPTPAPVAASSAEVDPAEDTNLIRAFDEYGRDTFISKQQWRDSVLLGNLEKHRDNPDELYGLLVTALQDGFAADVVGYAERLNRIDPIPSRGATILGIVYMEADRLDDAQRVFDEYNARHGEDGIVLTNLAKVYSCRGDDVLAESTLWHALELNPNQDSGFGWYVAIQRERGGDKAALDAFGQVATLPRSWRARLWLARDALQRDDLKTAEILYEEALALAERPIPADLLMQMSGDLGNGGHLAEIIRLVEPYFDPAFHGLQAGNNLIKANLDLGRLKEARNVLNQLFDQQRPDWKPTLGYWDTELAKAETERRAQTLPPGKLSVSLLSVEGPLWMRDGSPFAALLPQKRADSPHIAIFGSTALLAKAPEKPALQLTDSPGRLSRAVPLLLAESIHLTTDAVGLALIPWAQGQGFLLFGHACDDAALCDFSGRGEAVPDYVIGMMLDASSMVWKLDFRLVRRVDGRRLAEASVEVDAETPGSAIEGIVAGLYKLLTLHAGVHVTPSPSWYRRPTGREASDYLLRLEQQLTVACAHVDFLEGGTVYGEREMLDGVLQLSLSQPANPTVRMLLAQTFRQMKKTRPEILAEYKSRTDHLRRDYPITQAIDLLVDKAMHEAFAP